MAVPTIDQPGAVGRQENTDQQENADQQKSIDRQRDIDERREQLVETARHGNLSEAVKDMGKLYQKTGNSRVLNDLIALHSWNGTLGSVLDLCYPCDMKSLNENSLEALAKAHRNRQDFKTAAAFYSQLSQRNPNNIDGWLGLALTSAEMGEDIHAQKAIAHYRDLGKPGIERFENELYVMTVLQDRVGELGVLQAYYDYAPNRDIGLRFYKTAIELGASSAAQTIVNEHPEWFTGIDRYWLDYYQATLNIRSGISSYRQNVLDEGIQQLQQLAKVVPADHSLYQRIQLDIFYGLVSAKRYPEATANLAVIDTIENVPPYILEAKADLLIATRKPFGAVEIYSDLYAKNHDPEIGRKLYYAYMDAEQYEAGTDLLNQLLESQPPTRWDFTGSFRLNNEKYQQLLEQSILHTAWCGDLETAGVSLRAAVTEAPGNPWLWLDLGNVERWQGRFADAEKSYLRADALMSESSRGPAQRSLWVNQLEKGDWRDLNGQRQKLNSTYPDDEQKDINRRWAEATAPFLTIDLGRVRTENEKAGQAQNSEDWQYDVQLFSQRWEGQRFYAHDQKLYGKWEERDLYARYSGIGADLTWYPLTLDLEAGSGSQLNDKKYLWSSVNWSLDDQWSVQAAYRYNPSNTPLRALHDGHYMRQWSLGFVHKPAPDLSWGGQAQLYKFTDGNDRQILNGWLDARIWQTARYKLSAVAGITDSDNDVVPVNYFNPISDRNFNLELRHSYHLKLSDNWDLDQFLETGANRYHQSGFSTETGWKLGYSQQWLWRDRVSLKLGINHNKAIYDGEPEYGLSVFANIDVRFVP
ncbi:poly-beta-1,6 N-acetyl-D-glucosamine export porin PgaA [Hahella sp. CCB-MM4]|nr:poly-beta-1,6 N-acetyl-D-glucosamine export porin PgaA [Hahella sp. CCB-MM4]